MSMGTIIWILTIVICVIFLGISWKVKDDANVSFSNYAIGGASFGVSLIFFSQFASIMGVSNFFAHAGNAYDQGIGILAFILGEQGSKIVFALTMAGLIGHFTYNTLPELIDDLIVRDKLTRALASFMATLIMIASVGSQGKAFGDLFQVFTGVDPRPIVILFSAIFIIYTVFGGIYSVVWTDLFQGILCLVFGVASCVAGIFAPTVLSLLSKAYSFAGAGVVPLIIIGLLWKERKSEKIQMTRCNSKVSAWGARLGIIVGSVASQLKIFGDYGVISGVLLASSVIILVSMLTRNVPVEPAFASRGNEHPLAKAD